MVIGGLLRVVVAQGKPRSDGVGGSGWELVEQKWNRIVPGQDMFVPLFHSSLSVKY